MSEESCERCGRTFNDKAVKWKELLWHESCFRCENCLTKLNVGEKFFVKQVNSKSLLYCKEDYERLNNIQCFRCNKTIKENFVECDSMKFHKKCIECDGCKKTLINDNLLQMKIGCCNDCRKNERIEKKFQNKTTEKKIERHCSTCEKDIENDDDYVLLANGTTNHLRHYKCESCHCQLEKCEVIRNDKMKLKEMFCGKCAYERKVFYRCYQCKKLIYNTRFIHALNRTYHIEHFHCHLCYEIFDGKSFHEMENEPYCFQCYKRKFGNICFSCDEIIYDNEYSIFNKKWCVDHFTCHVCGKKLNEKEKISDFNYLPHCTECFERLPKMVRENAEKDWKFKTQNENGNKFEFYKLCLN
ncbi:hypothetical protein SNEBB_005509 [Seison nebaliae]|nr:hypothetical protein SNEBB_005509 [Seison nebaliae]